MESLLIYAQGPSGIIFVQKMAQGSGVWQIMPMSSQLVTIVHEMKHDYSLGGHSQIMF